MSAGKRKPRYGLGAVLMPTNLPNHFGRRQPDSALAVLGAELVVGEHHCFLSRHAQSRQTYLISVKASSPWRAPSRARPDCFMPPKGIGAPVTLVRLTATMP